MALFGNDREQAASRQGGVQAPNQVNMVAEGTVFEGTLRAESDIRISGRIVGKLTVGGRAFVAPEGSIEGEVKATDADIAGQVQGELHVEERLMLRSSARIEGTIRTGRLIVEEGALFNGECQMGQSGHLRKQPQAVPEVVRPKHPELPKEPRPLDAGDAARTPAF